MKAMYIGITGMSAQQQALNVTSNNIANSQTTGYKSQRTEFEDLFYQRYKAPVAMREDYAGTNPVEVGNGVKVGAITTNHEQGSVKYTGKKTDLAIEGKGFFILGDAYGNVTNRTYTRDGSFKISTDGKLVSTDGRYVLGWNADPVSGALNTGAIIEPIKLPLGEIYQPRVTKNVGLEGNLDMSKLNGNVTGIQVPTYDSRGIRHDVNFDFIKTGNNQYSYIATVDDQYFTPSAGITKAVLAPSADMANIMDNFGPQEYRLTVNNLTGGNVSVTVSRRDIGGTGSWTNVFTSQVFNDVNQTITLENGSGNSWFTIDYKAGNYTTSYFRVQQAGHIEFDSTGHVSRIFEGGTQVTKPTIEYNPNNGAQNVLFDVDMNAFTGLGVDSNLVISEQDGYGAAVLLDFSVQDGGIINGYFDDGTMRAIGQIAVATFSNEEGLSRIGKQQFVETPNSGLPEIGTSGTNMRGLVKGETLEASNVDLAQEFVDLMVTQKAFTGNTKVIQTADTALNAVINLIR